MWGTSWNLRAFWVRIICFSGVLDGMEVNSWNWNWKMVFFYILIYVFLLRVFNSLHIVSPLMMMVMMRCLMVCPTKDGAGFEVYTC